MTRRRFTIPHLTLTAAAIALWLGSVDAANQQFTNLINKMELDVLELGKQVEDLYLGRCQNIDLDACNMGSYDHCRSSFPQPECPASLDFRIPQCGSPDGSCSGTWDFSVSSVWLPSALANGQNGNPTDKDVIETLCLTQSLDDWFVQKREQDASFWSAFGVEPQGMYFGSKEGAFRIYPASPTATCGAYDPRIRPWYVAGSSGPKNVVMVLDVSGSMSGPRISFLKTAAKRVVETLGIYDRIAIVPFAGQASLIARNGGTFLTGSQDNKNFLIDQIDKLVASGPTNFQDAFRTVFGLLDRSFEEEHNVDCNTAILFLTDGVMTEPDPNVVSPEVVMNEIAQGISERQQRFGKPIVLFTYSLSEQSSVHAFPKDLSCRVENGIWAKIKNEKEILEGLSSYYQFFALELSQSEEFTSWVEPYVYSIGSIFGTTVSTPVYDRTLDPPVFLGVAAIDFSMQSFDIALGNEIGSQATIDEFIARPAICPNLELSKCMLESFRRQGLGGEDALCYGIGKSASCTENEFAQFETSDCNTQADYPSNLWANIDQDGLSYEERTCCTVQEGTINIEDADECREGATGSGSEGLSVGAIIGIVAGAIGGLVVAVAVFWLVKRKKNSSRYQESTPTRKTENTGTYNITVDPDVHVMRPPATNPSAPTQ